MSIVSLMVMAVCLGIYHICLFSLDFFQPAVSQNLLINLSCALVSDISLMLFLSLVILALARWRSLHRWLRWLATIVTVVFCLFLASHMRYVEHFAMNLRPFHVQQLGMLEIWRVGFWMMLQSWRADLIIITGVMLAIFATKRYGKTLENNWQALPAKKARRILILMAVGVIGTNALMIELRILPGIHPVLKYNPLTAYYYNYREFQKIKALPMPSNKELAKLRSLLGGARVFDSGPVGQQYALWQHAITTAPSQGTDDDASLRDKLKAFIAHETAVKGPWNVVLVISESLRANELSSMGNHSEAYRNLTPAFDRIAHDGVRFTNLMSAGFKTHFGQDAEMCSLYSSNDFSLIASVPMSRAVCLTDVFSHHGYETLFFYGSDNNFDNQNTFYPRHHVSKVYGEIDMPKNLPRGGWGVSDGALFDYTLGQLAGAHQPFFATVLTLTNHAPYKIPEDMPAGGNNHGLDILGDLVRYVDWSTGRFYDNLLAKFPHTIFLLIADHGRFWGDEVIIDLPMQEQLLRSARIPLYIVVPGAPADITGHEVGRLASNVDVPPTLLSLLGWNNEPQQFMGEDAFVRKGPIYLEWWNKLVSVTPKGTDVGHVAIEAVNPELVDLFGAIRRYNLIAPSRKEIQATF